MKITLKMLSRLIPDTATVLIVLDGNALKGYADSFRVCLNDYALNAKVISIEADVDTLKIILTEDDEGSGDE